MSNDLSYTYSPKQSKIFAWLIKALWLSLLLSLLDLPSTPVDYAMVGLIMVYLCFMLYSRKKMEGGIILLTESFVKSPQIIPPYKDKQLNYDDIVSLTQKQIIGQDIAIIRDKNKTRLTVDRSAFVEPEKFIEFVACLQSRIASAMKQK